MALQSASNRREYRELALSVWFVAAILWPVYGLFCQYVLDLPERMIPRIGLGLTYMSLGLLARAGRFGGRSHLIWILAAAYGMVWLPWALYLDSARAAYWVASLSFFGTVLGLLVRAWELPLTVLLGVALIVLTGKQPTASIDLGMIAVFAISCGMGSLVIQALRRARRRIEIQNRQIRHQNEKLQHLDRAKNEFTAAIAHDLRTPLTVALSLTQDLGKEDLSPVARTRLDSLAMALDQMRRQSADLLDLERFQLGVARLDPVELDTCTWLARFEEGLTSLARTRRLTFQVVHHDRDLRACFDPVRMETVLHNLVGNALKFTPQGGHIEVHVAREPDRTLVLSVIDDGEGIPAAALPTIFDRYQQVDRGPGTYTVGAGIGLALVKEIVEAHSGSIRVESTPGLGSLFEIRLPGALSHDHDPLDTTKHLPLPLPPPPPPPVLPAPVRPSRGAILALVVEDDMLLRHVLVDLLAGVARCATARDGREALRLVVELQPDIVITDLVMPTMDGMSLLAAIRQDPVIANTPVIVLTGDPQTLTDRLAPDSRLAIHGKPFNRTDLVETILDLAHPGLGAETDIETNP